MHWEELKTLFLVNFSFILIYQIFLVMEPSLKQFETRAYFDSTIKHDIYGHNSMVNN